MNKSFFFDDFWHSKLILSDISVIENMTRIRLDSPQATLFTENLDPVKFS